MSFEHDAQQRFGARVPDEKPALARNARFHAGDRVGHCRHGVQFHLFAYAHVEQHLRIRGQVGREVGQRSSGERHCPKHVQRGTETVAGEQVVREDDVAGLLTAEREIPLQHLLHHVLVADRRSHEIDAQRLQRELETDVAHDRRDNRVASEPAFPLKLTSAHQQHSVAVDNMTVMVHEDRAIAVAVECHAHGAAARHDGLGQTFGMRRAAVKVDVAAVGPVPDRNRLEAEAVEQLGGDSRRRPVGAVDGNREPVDGGRLGEHEAQMTEIGIDKVGARDVARGTRTRGPGGVGHDGLDLALDHFGEFFASAREHLDAVVLVRVVRGGDDHARVVRPGSRQECDRRRRHDPGAGDRRALAAGAVRELGLDPLARLTRVAADEKLGRLRAVRERAYERRAESSNRRRIERRGPRLAANAVGPEQSSVCHW